MFSQAFMVNTYLSEEKKKVPCFKENNKLHLFTFGFDE